ncbi:type IX secretion system sortase PorU [Flavobacteriales bacterium]|nr:type IX secretion system sortase PorU [Flavobacteriales bacterium]
MNKRIFIALFFTVFCVGLFAQNSSVLAQGDWYKISTTKNGIYKLSYSSFIDLGIDVGNLQISAIKLYGSGGGMLPHLNSDFRHNDLPEMAIKIYDSNNNGVFESSDYILFYGMSADIWKLSASSNLFEHKTHLFSDKVYYFLTVDNQDEGKRVELKNTLLNPTKIITDYNAFSYHEQELENIIHSGNKWFGERFFYDNSQNFSFSFPNLILSEAVNIKAAVVGRSLQSSNFKINANSTFLSTLNLPNVVTTYATEYAKEASNNSLFNSNSSNIDVNLEYSSGDSGAEAWLNYIEINARRELKLSGNYLTFRDVESQSDEIGKFEIENANGVSVWDVSDPTNVLELTTNLVGNVLSFNDSLNSINEYIAYNSSSYLTPTLHSSVANQDLHGISNNVEFVIVSHPDFLSAANRLADFHLEKDNMNSIVVTPQQIYNEFSSGMQDVSAIRDFLKHQYDKENSSLKYLLLFGDGSYDPKNRVDNNTNFIVTYQSANSTHPTQSYVTDDYFGLLDEDEGLFINDLVDIGIGRFPVATLKEANVLVDKVERYYEKSSFGSWRNDVAFIADDGDANDGNTHMWQADSLANHLADNFDEINIQKIYLDNYYQESTPGGPRSSATQSAINNKVDKGALLINYTGHGGPLGWTQERILEVDQINKWSNIDNLPLFMTATCKFSYFDNPEEKSAGEYVLLNENGGAIALLSTTRLVFVGPNYNLNTKFIQNIFKKKDDEFPRLGDLFKTTKVLSGTSANNRNFTLLGNPALRLAYPKYDVRTTIVSDTLKALSEVTIEGEIEEDGFFISDFNGTIYPTVYDKELIKTTLGQESCTPMPYRDQNNILYKGAATVKDGKFSFSFIVPKDIAYNYGAGKISYYAVSDDEIPVDASGSEKEFVIGGSAENVVYDYDEAELSLFINTRTFKDGGITDENPILIADVFDESGINTVGNGIGHDITAVLDGNTSNPYVLNDFYEAAKDDFTKGIINFPFYNLEKGEHTLTLKIWDVFNNSSEATISFVVSDENEFTIADYITYPNPFSSSTDIYFQHNKPNQNLGVVLEIYSITGVLVKRFEETYNDDGYRVGPINWNGKDEYGGNLSAGMYIAKLNIYAEDGAFTSNSIRIILLPQ